MPKFARSTSRPPAGAQTPIRTVAASTAYTHEGGLGAERDPKSELFLLAVTNMVGEQTFYESGEGRDDRFARLVTRVAESGDWDWLYQLTRFVRHDVYLRSVSIVLACEYAKAWQVLPHTDTDPSPRVVVSVACARADEPAEIVGYWAQQYGRAEVRDGVRIDGGRDRATLPMAVKRGLADACVRLYNERSALKYNGDARRVRMADVLELVHPRPKDERQAALFRWLLDTRHGHQTPDTGLLPTITRRAELDAVPVERRREMIDGDGWGSLRDAGMTWEALSGWLQGPMDAGAWEAVIPSMGYMALLRNLRNFLEAGVSDSVLDSVAAKLADPEEVRGSRQLPIRFYNAWLMSGGVKDAVEAWGKDQGRFGDTLKTAIELALANVAELPGHTLVMIDVSGSMAAPLSDRSRAGRWEYAALFGAAVARRSARADVLAYNTQHVRLPPYESLMDAVRATRPLVGGGTHTWTMAEQLFKEIGPDRLVILTDEQTADRDTGVITCPVYTFNLAGYRAAQSHSVGNRFTVGGLTDAGFRMISLLEAGTEADWPWRPNAVADLSGSQDGDG